MMGAVNRNGAGAQGGRGIYVRESAYPHSLVDPIICGTPNNTVNQSMTDRGSKGGCIACEKRRINKVNVTLKFSSEALLAIHRY